MRYVSLSGGADSTACAILWHEAGYDFELVFADTGAELPETYWIIPRIAAALGKKLRVVCGGTFYQHFIANGYMPPQFKIKWCTRLLKIAPLNKYFNPDDIVAVGLRADEPGRVERALSRPQPYTKVYPLYEAGMVKADVRKLCENRGIGNPCYSWRSNVSCFCCPFQRKQDWRNMAKTHPDLFALTEEWEQLGTSKESARGKAALCGWTPTKWTLRQLRETDENQLSLLPECNEEACLICR